MGRLMGEGLGWSIGDIFSNRWGRSLERGIVFFLLICVVKCFSLFGEFVMLFF